jgi:hypothetical protein
MPSRNSNRRCNNGLGLLAPFAQKSTTDGSVHVFGFLTKADDDRRSELELAEGIADVE